MLFRGEAFFSVKNRDGNASNAPRCARRVAHVVKAIEHGDEIVVAAGHLLPSGDFKRDAVRDSSALG